MRKSEFQIHTGLIKNPEKVGKMASLFKSFLMENLNLKEKDCGGGGGLRHFKLCVNLIYSKKCIIQMRVFKVISSIFYLRTALKAAGSTSGMVTG